ncbi:hypothetical protein [Spongiactinospora gelatinilytica]|uniref:hypothetical protein n=1 Tax=Spongiactinospora gelatinilytica TaxID=2666298 RepID=UPI001314E149|nr:hypothetical protein [Spongiactinospora gelatinilytica]
MTDPYINYAQAYRAYGARKLHRLACAGIVPAHRQGRLLYLAVAALRGGAR